MCGCVCPEKYLWKMKTVGNKSFAMLQASDRFLRLHPSASHCLGNTNVIGVNNIPIFFFNVQVGRVILLSEYQCFNGIHIQSKSDFVGCSIISGQSSANLKILGSHVHDVTTLGFHSTNCHDSIDNAHWVARIHPKNLVDQSFSFYTRALQSVIWHVFGCPGPPRAFCHILALNIVKNTTDINFKAVLRLLHIYNIRVFWGHLIMHNLVVCGVIPVKICSLALSMLSGL